MAESNCGVVCPVSSLLQYTPAGLYCEPGNFWIDPWRPVSRAVITHAHSDHARAGSERYLAAAVGCDLLRLRLGDQARIDGVAYGAPIALNGVRVSLHPAGHVLGSAQVRIEHRGEVVIVSGDYKRAADPTCAAFEPLACNTFVSEATFGLPIYRWPDVDAVFVEVHDWWRENQSAGTTSLLCTYALGKAQRVLAHLDPTIGPIMLHGAVTRLAPAYASAGVELPEAHHAQASEVKALKGAALVLAPPSVLGSPWLRRLGPVSTACASGWMLIRGRRRQRNVDRGFVLSDHADWDDLVATIEATGAEQILLTHGHAQPLVRWLTERGLQAGALDTHFGDDEEADAEPDVE